MPYSQIRGRRPFERASKIAHTEIIKNPAVQQFVGSCELPKPPPAEDLGRQLVEIPPARGNIRSVIAIDGGLNETYVRKEFPSASIAFLTLGPLLLNLEDLSSLERQPFIGPEDMQALKRIQRYNLVLPTRVVRTSGVATFRQGVRKAVQDFLIHGDAHLMEGFAWLLFRGWRAKEEREYWSIPRCPNPDCFVEDVRFRENDPFERTCSDCGEPIYLSDALRLYERVDEEIGAGGILAYLLTALEQIVLVHMIRSVLNLKPDLLREILFVKDGPLAFFGVTAPLYKPMRDLMQYLASEKGGPLINLVGLEKSGPFVEHAGLIEDQLPSGKVLVLDNDYIYRHIVPGDPAQKQFGKNTYYGAKVIFKGDMNDTYVATVPTASYKQKPTFGDLLNGPDVLRVTSRLRCSMYDNALVPVVLANRLVSLADIPSTEILKKFVKDHLRTTT
jgi:hypothetical protein